MDKREWPDMPDTWHCINAAGSIIQIDAAVRLEIERWMANLEYPRDHFAQLTITSILGEEITIFADAINMIYETNPTERIRSWMMGKLIKEEQTQNGFTDLD